MTTCIIASMLDDYAKGELTTSMRTPTNTEMVKARSGMCFLFLEPGRH